MRASLKLRLGAVLAAAATLSLSAMAAEIWVSPGGNDHNPGTKVLPLASPAMALRQAREMRRVNGPAMSGAITIVLRGGLYRLTDPLFVRWEDSGTENSPTVIASAPGEHAVLSGGVPIGGWARLTAPVDGLPPTARAHVWVADVPQVNGHPLKFRELWVGESKATRARNPNDPELARLAGWDRKGEVATVPASVLSGRRDPNGVEMVQEQQWEIAILRLRTIEAAGDVARLGFRSPEGPIEFQHPWPQPILPPKGGGAFYLVNAIEFLDSPGEWFEDTAAGRIYYWPRPGEDLNREEVVAPALTSVVVCGGTLDRPVQHVRFERVAFAHTAWNEAGRSGHVPLQAGMPMVEAYKLEHPGTPDKPTLENQAWIRRMPAAVVVKAANHVEFTRCQFEHAGASALDLGAGVHDSSVEGCMVRDVGGNGIQVGSFQEGGVETHVPYLPSDEREVSARIRIANNVLRDTANADWGSVAVISGYARQVSIEHNDISGTSYTGISVGWGWTRTPNASRDNRIVANRITHVATRVCDTAGIYTLSAQPGTVVSGNYVGDIVMSPYVDRPQHWFYLYTDEGTSGVTVRDNWCPAEKFLRNANGPGNVWNDNGPMVAKTVREHAGLEPEFAGLLGEIGAGANPSPAPARTLKQVRQGRTSP
ncbi:MAG TPA: right-handed parallel beta-helix repeat-containing protein [Opitutaceae bacterium]|nr:right-handed parallel beta-helix repeat-containing protein [Opitutaceae bacterium]